MSGDSERQGMICLLARSCSCPVDSACILKVMKCVNFARWNEARLLYGRDRFEAPCVSQHAVVVSLMTCSALSLPVLGRARLGSARHARRSV